MGLSEYGAEIDKVLAMIPYLEQLHDENVGFAVSTTDKYLYYKVRRGKTLPIAPGDPVKPDSIAAGVIKKGDRVAVAVPKGLYGMEAGYKGVGVPVREDGRVVGTLIMGRAMYLEDDLNELAGKLGAAVAAVSGGADGFAASAEQLAAAASSLAGNAEKIRTDVGDLDAIIGLIMEVASQTHLLGLNAAMTR